VYAARQSSMASAQGVTQEATNPHSRQPLAQHMGMGEEAAQHMGMGEEAVDL
jgi:hypothetical protein